MFTNTFDIVLLSTKIILQLLSFGRECLTFWIGTIKRRMHKIWEKACEEECFNYCYYVASTPNPLKIRDYRL